MRVRYNKTKQENKNAGDRVVGLFPTPIYFSEIKRDFTQSELKFVEKNKHDPVKNDGNITSRDNYILNQKPFSRLKKELQSKVNSYFKEVVDPVDGITPYITQSWLNYTQNNEYHHSHHHSNSLVSGVFYFDCDQKFDRISFYKDSFGMERYFTFKKKNFNYFNSEDWWFPVKSKDLIMFPSYLTHKVEVKEGSNLRISLAFNVFIKGKIGNKFNLNELNFK
jgi:uncharacterized protein (TIGR02466 family)|tara:strand:+ start:472 stop:1137 length:666 start_codon:yes stop_codon:yes gene_type:complete